jgi:hypothetical protein
MLRESLVSWSDADLQMLLGLSTINSHEYLLGEEPPSRRIAGASCGICVSPKTTHASLQNYEIANSCSSRSTKALHGNHHNALIRLTYSLPVRGPRVLTRGGR